MTLKSSIHHCYQKKKNSEQSFTSKTSYHTSTTFVFFANVQGNLELEKNKNDVTTIVIAFIFYIFNRKTVENVDIFFKL